MIFYDEDTKMFFTAVKGESTIVFHELTDKPPHLSPGEGTSFSAHTLCLSNAATIAANSMLSQHSPMTRE